MPLEDPQAAHRVPGSTNQAELATEPSRETGSENPADEGALTGILSGLTELKIGYARVSTLDQDLTAQRDAHRADSPSEC